MPAASEIEVFANIGGVEDARLAVEFGAEGVGLLRTEFLYLERPALPSEQEQADTLREIAEILGVGPWWCAPSMPVPISRCRRSRWRPRRTPSSACAASASACASRAARHTAARDRARRRRIPAEGDAPDDRQLGEFGAARKLSSQACADTGMAMRPELGIMVEVPAAALTASELAPQVDFFSLGTNDLTQYTMAAERGNAALEPLLAEPQPAVLRLVQETVRSRRRARSVGRGCGEMAGDPAAAALLVGLGRLRAEHVAAADPEVKQALRGLDLAQARAAAERALRVASAAAAREHGARTARPRVRRARVSSLRSVEAGTFAALRTSRALAIGTSVRIAASPVILGLLLSHDWTAAAVVFLVAPRPTSSTAGSRAAGR